MPIPQDSQAFTTAVPVYFLSGLHSIEPDKNEGTAAPTIGTWPLGWIIWNSNPVAGENIGWVCVTGGTPGTWEPWGLISL